MNKNVIFSRFDSTYKVRICVLLALWGIGLILGILISKTFHAEYGSCLQQCITNSPSPFLCFVAAFAPAAVLAFVIIFRIFLICYPLFLVDAICRGFCGMLAFCEFGSGAWLIRLLFMFSSGCASVLMWWLLLRHISNRRANGFRDIWLASVILSAACVLDIFAISPFLSKLF